MTVKLDSVGLASDVLNVMTHTLVEEEGAVQFVCTPILGTGLGVLEESGVTE